MQEPWAGRKELQCGKVTLRTGRYQWVWQNKRRGPAAQPESHCPAGPQCGDACQTSADDPYGNGSGNWDWGWGQHGGLWGPTLHGVAYSRRLLSWEQYQHASAQEQRDYAQPDSQGSEDELYAYSGTGRYLFFPVSLQWQLERRWLYMGQEFIDSTVTFSTYLPHG